MEKTMNKSYSSFTLLILSFLLLIGSLYSTVAKANTPSQLSSSTQLAYFIGYHSSPGYHYAPPPRAYHRNKFFWTGWRHVGHGCRKNCLIDRWSGRVIRCNRVCHR